ncbi:hypothetical protein [Ligilactobacillus equi]
MPHNLFGFNWGEVVSIVTLVGVVMTYVQTNMRHQAREATEKDLQDLRSQLNDFKFAVNKLENMLNSVNQQLKKVDEHDKKLAELENRILVIETREEDKR